MLVLSRRKNETIVIDGCVQIEVLQIKGNEIRLGIQAPAAVKILRGELTPFACQNTPQELSAVERLGKEQTSKKKPLKTSRSSKGLVPIEFASDEELDSIRGSLMELSMDLPEGFAAELAVELAAEQSIDDELPGIRINGQRVAHQRNFSNAVGDRSAVGDRGKEFDRSKESNRSKECNRSAIQSSASPMSAGRGNRQSTSSGLEVLVSATAGMEDDEDLGSGRVRIRRSLERLRAQSTPALRALTFKIDDTMSEGIVKVAEEAAS